MRIVDHHAPGAPGADAIEIASWSGRTLQHLLVDIQALAEVLTSADRTRLDRPGRRFSTAEAHRLRQLAARER